MILLNENFIADTIKNFNANITEIDTDKIILTERIHLVKDLSPNADLDYKYDAIFVKKIDDDKYTLVMNWGDYMRAVKKNAKTVKCLITNLSRKDFIYKYGQIPKNIDEITIPKKFTKTPPREAKINDIIKYYKANNMFDANIVINSEGLLLDGYARFLAAQKLNMTQVPVLILKNKRVDKTSHNKKKQTKGK